MNEMTLLNILRSYKNGNLICIITFDLQFELKYGEK
jgi:hypothetical protein